MYIHTYTRLEIWYSHTVNDFKVLKLQPLGIKIISHKNLPPMRENFNTEPYYYTINTTFVESY